MIFHLLTFRRSYRHDRKRLALSAGVNYWSGKVCAHANKRLEKCDPYSNQVQFSIRGIQRIPADAYGVYGIWFRRRCIYVGKAADQSISERLEQHWKGSHNDRLQAWIESKRGLLRVAFLIVRNKSCIDVYERLCIDRFQPIANRIRYRKRGGAAKRRKHGEELELK